MGFLNNFAMLTFHNLYTKALTLNVILLKFTSNCELIEETADLEWLVSFFSSFKLLTEMKKPQQFEYFEVITLIKYTTLRYMFSIVSLLRCSHNVAVIFAF